MDSLEDIRKYAEIMYNQQFDEIDYVWKVTDVQMPGPGGKVPLQLYQPSEGANDHLLFYFHGGGFFWGSITSHDAVCRRLAKATQAVIVAVDYRLAPEHPFPAGVDDCCAATQWVHNNAAELGLPSGRLAVGVSGDSAGGNLAACVALRARSDAAFPHFQYQILICPVLRHLLSGPMEGSWLEFKDDPELPFQKGVAAFRDYFGGSDGHIKDPQAFPLEAEDLSGLPPTLIFTARDILRNDGMRYAERLQAAGVDVQLHDFDTAHVVMTHAPKKCPDISRQAYEVIGKFAQAHSDACH